MGNPSLHPRRLFPRIAAQSDSVWLTPLVSGPVRQAEVMNAANILPPDFQYYSPDQQAQLQQALASSASPNFVYAFPVAAILEAASRQHL